MAAKKTTIIIDEQLLNNFDLVAEGMGYSRNRLLSMLMQKAVDDGLAKARAIQEKQAELERLKNALNIVENL